MSTQCLPVCCTNRPNFCNQSVIGIIFATAIAVLALSIIGITASNGGIFNFIVQFGPITNGILCGVSSCILILDIIWFLALHKTKNKPSPRLLVENPEEPSPWLLAEDLEEKFEGAEDKTRQNINKQPAIHKSNFDLLPFETYIEIFSYLDNPDLLMSCLVNKYWRRVVTETVSNKIYPKLIKIENVIGHEIWGKFGEVKIPALPLNILQILRSPCPFWEGNQVIDTHLLVLIPQKISEKAFTLNTINMLITQHFGNPFNGYKEECIQQHGNAMTQQSYWLLIPKDVISDRSKGIDEQKQLIPTQMGYVLPRAREIAAVCMLMQSSNESIPFMSNYVLCEGTVEVKGESETLNYALTVGDCKDHPIGVREFLAPPSSCGIVPVRRFALEGQEETEEEIKRS